MHRSRSHALRRFASLLILLAAPAGCGKSTQLEAGAVLLDLSVGAGVSTPDELQISVYDDTGTIWNKRVPESGALTPESATHLGTVLLQPGTTQGARRGRNAVDSRRIARHVSFATIVRRSRRR